jgi:D-galactarolactone cycloisomerase
LSNDAGEQLMSRIERVEAFLHRAPIDPPLVAGSGPQEMFEHIVVRITDSDGGVGYGECDATAGAMAILETLAHDLLGLDPLKRGRHLADLRRRNVSGFQISGISIALDDLVARSLRVPISALHGGPVRDRVRAYAASYGSLPGRTLESWLAEAAEVVARGFAALKLRLGVLPTPEECDALAELRERIPASLALMADGNGGFDPTTAREMGRCAEALGLLWFEEPLPPQGYRGYTELAADLDVWLAGGELSDSPDAAFELMARRAVDVVQPDPVICGGIGETIFIAGVARLMGLMCVPHTSGGAIGVAAGLQALACIPDAPSSAQHVPIYLEYPSLTNPVQAAIAPGRPVPIEGWVEVPPTPGLGIEIDAAAVEDLAVTRFSVGSRNSGFTA